jgi:hypothetical protein
MDTDAEREVREVWELVHCCDGSYRGYPRGTVLLQDVNGHWFDFETWQAALDFTNQRKREIAEIDEQIAQMKSDRDLSEGPVIRIYVGILLRLQSIRAELTKGMSAQPSGEEGRDEG